MYGCSFNIFLLTYCCHADAVISGPGGTPVLSHFIKLVLKQPLAILLMLSWCSGRSASSCGCRIFVFLIVNTEPVSLCSRWWWNVILVSNSYSSWRVIVMKKPFIIDTLSPGSRHGSSASLSCSLRRCLIVLVVVLVVMLSCLISAFLSLSLVFLSPSIFVLLSLSSP